MTALLGRGWLVGMLPFLSSEALCIFLTSMGKQMVEYEGKSNRYCKISRLPKLFFSFI